MNEPSPASSDTTRAAANEDGTTTVGPSVDGPPRWPTTWADVVRDAHRLRVPF